MNKLLKRLMIIKDVLWAFGILICLVAILVGFLFSAVTRYNGDCRDRTIDFSNVKVVDEGTAVTVPTGTVVVGNVRTAEATKDAGDSYINSLTFLLDSSLIGLREMNLVSSDIWGSESGKLPITSSGTWNIVYADGSKIPPSSAAMITKPSILILAVGGDSLAGVSRTDFVSAYTAVINGIKQLSPATTIVCCSITPVSASYAGEDGLTNDMINEANSWITQICIENDLTYCSIADAVSSGGALAAEYSAIDGRSINISGLQQIISYLRTHAVS